jgi:hypothetical protein
MVSRLAVEPGFGAAELKLSRLSALDQHIQIAINRAQADIGEPRPNDLE